MTLLEPQSRFEDKPLTFQVVCSQNGTAVLKGLRSSPPRPKPDLSKIQIAPHEYSHGLSTQKHSFSKEDWHPDDFGPRPHFGDKLRIIGVEWFAPKTGLQF